MKKIIGIVAILLLVSGYAVAGEFWHFGVGARVAGVMPGEEYKNTLGMGILLTFGDPDSRFTTQMDLDTWSVKYTKEGDMIETSPLGTDDTLRTYKLRDYEYSGIGIGFFEKYRFYDLSDRFSSYVIGGLGGYFLDRKREQRNDDATRTLKTTGLNSFLQLAGGIGLEARFNHHIASFIEGRYVGILNGDDLDKDIIKGYFGFRYTF